MSGCLVEFLYLSLCRSSPVREQREALTSLLCNKASIWWKCWAGANPLQLNFSALRQGQSGANSSAASICSSRSRRHKLEMKGVFMGGGPVLYISPSTTSIVISNENQSLLSFSQGWTDINHDSLLYYFVRAPFLSFTSLSLEFYRQLIYGWSDRCALSDALNNDSDVSYRLLKRTVFRIHYLKL